MTDIDALIQQAVADAVQVRINAGLDGAMRDIGRCAVLTVTQAADMLHVSVAQVYRLIQAHPHLATRLSPQTVRVIPAELAALIAVGDAERCPCRGGERMRRVG